MVLKHRTTGSINSNFSKKINKGSKPYGFSTDSLERDCKLQVSLNWEDRVCWEFGENQSGQNSQRARKKSIGTEKELWLPPESLPWVFRACVWGTHLRQGKEPPERSRWKNSWCSRRPRNFSSFCHLRGRNLILYEVLRRILKRTMPL